MKKYYTVNHNGQEMNFNHHDEIGEQIKNYCKNFLLHEWAESGKEVFKVGETEILVASLLESWTGYPSNRTAKILFERLADSVYNDIFSHSINELIKAELAEGEKIEVTFPGCDFSITTEQGEI